MAERLITLEECLAAGFTNAAYMDLSKIELMPEIRGMCEDNRCGRYNKSWACPPACGTLEELRARVLTYDYGVLLQVTGHLEDSFDIETMNATEEASGRALDVLAGRIRPRLKALWAMRAGGCTRCEECTYPDKPCRFPDRLEPSMEACGLFVSRECERCGIPYYYGPNTMTYVAAVLVKE